MPTREKSCDLTAPKRASHPDAQRFRQRHAKAIAHASSQAAEPSGSSPPPSRLFGEQPDRVAAWVGYDDSVNPIERAVRVFDRAQQQSQQQRRYVMETLGITIDCGVGEMDLLAEFWASALGYERVLADYLIDPDGVRPRLVLQVVPEPKTTKNRWHLDLYVEGLDARAPKVELLIRLGAIELHHVDTVTYGYTNVFTAMTDPVGNEFCVCAPHIRGAGVSAEGLAS
jgi:hypothetical protein